MTAAVGDLVLTALVVIALVSVGVAVLAVRDCIARGDAQIREAVRQQEQWEAARNVTGRVSR